ncbi:NTF2-domain-containing protein [Lichtheimia hyalospora FSU 10163]|nr:NTF2-domain-containing protein [Lichtheimia hyalospora FSU 10163]
MTATVSQPTQADVPVENGSKSPLASHEIGLIFVREYYTFLNKSPNKLYGFYGKDSFMVRGDEGQSSPSTAIQGQEEIRKKIEDLHFEDCRVLVSQVDSQISANNGILVQVLGEMCNMDGPLQKFSQTFFLAPQINGYYVLNDIFRFLKDEVNIDYYTCDEEKKAAAAAAAAETAAKDQEQVPENTTTTSAKPLAYTSVEPDSTVATTSSTPVIETASVTTNAQSTPVVEEKPAPVAPTTTEKPAADKSKVSEGKDQEKAKDQEQSSKVPKTWSNIAAGSDNKWSSSSTSPSATAATATTPTTPAATTTPTTTTTTNATPATETKPSQGNKPSHGKDHGKEQSNKETTDVFLKNIKSLTMDQIKEAFTAEFGEVKSVTIPPGKPTGFLTFANPESCQKALKQRRVEVGEVHVIVEERRVPGSRYTRHQQNGTGGSYERRFQQNRRGGGPPRGGKSRGGGNQK